MPNLKKENEVMESIKVLINLIGIPLLAWVLVTLYDFNAQVTKLNVVSAQLAEQLMETKATIAKHDDQIRSLEISK